MSEKRISTDCYQLTSLNKTSFTDIDHEFIVFVSKCESVLLALLRRLSFWMVEIQKIFRRIPYRHDAILQPS